MHSEQFAERITDNAETEGKEDDGKAGKQRDPPGCGDEALAFRDHDAPFGNRWLDAEPKIADSGAAEQDEHGIGPVSYTHLTLPTIYSV